MNAQDQKEIADWLVDGARSSIGSPQMVADMCERLVRAGLPLWRVGIFVRTLHPDVLGVNFIWKPGAEVTFGTADFDVLDSPEFRSSPLAIVFGEGREVRHLTGDPEGRRFPILDDMRAEGVTDYIALPLHATDGTIHATSWTTRHAGGFSDEQLDGLRSLMPALARVVEIANHRRKASILLDTYVGSRAGERILGGRSGAATPRPCMPRSGCRTCAVSPRCRTGCRPKPWSTFSTTISIARCRRSAATAGKS
jgi:adenylate cyclase